MVSKSIDRKEKLSFMIEVATEKRLNALVPKKLRNMFVEEAIKDALAQRKQTENTNHSPCPQQ